jgi:glutamate synthase domain-containing protein 2
MRACHTNNCPVGIATQKPHSASRLKIDELDLTTWKKEMAELSGVEFSGVNAR